jgi:hypothetical protein
MCCDLKLSDHPKEAKPAQSLIKAFSNTDLCLLVRRKRLLTHWSLEKHVIATERRPTCSILYNRGAMDRTQVNPRSSYDYCAVVFL